MTENRASALGLRPFVAALAATLVGGAVALAASPAVAAPTTTTLATYQDGAQIAARGSTVVVAQRNPAGQDATLLIGTGGVPTAAPGAGALPIWAQPSIGTDRSGRVVVLYPRCSGSAISSCDLYRYDPSTARERRVAGVNRASAGEVDGAMDRGAVAFNRWRGSATPVTADTWPASGGQIAGERTNLFYLPAGGAARLVTDRGGRQLAIRDRWIAQVRITNRAAGECGRSAVELVSVGGRRKTARTSTCGLTFRVPAAPTFLGGDLLWGEARSDGASPLYRYRLSDGRLRQTPLSLPFRVFAHTGATAGYALTIRYLVGEAPAAGGPTPFVFDLVSVTGV